MYGYNGKILRINLKERTIKIEKLAPTVEKLKELGL